MMLTTRSLNRALMDGPVSEWISYLLVPYPLLIDDLQDSLGLSAASSRRRPSVHIIEVDAIHDEDGRVFLEDVSSIPSDSTGSLHRARKEDARARTSP